MRALVRQGPAAEVWPESEWLPWVVPEYLCAPGMPYALADRVKERPEDYDVVVERGLRRAYR